MVISVSALRSGDSLEIYLRLWMESSADATPHSNICPSQQVPFLLRSASCCCQAFAFIGCCYDEVSTTRLSVVAFVECLPSFTSLSGILALLVICEVPGEVALFNFQSQTGGRPEVGHYIVISSSLGGTLISKHAA